MTERKKQIREDYLKKMGINKRRNFPYWKMIKDIIAISILFPVTIAMLLVFVITLKFFGPFFLKAFFG